MSATLPLTGNGDITMNSVTPADGQIKLADSGSGAGKNLSIIGSNGPLGNNNGGDIIISAGAKTGTGSNGKVDFKLAGPFRISDSNANPSIIVAPPPTGTANVDRANIQAAIDALPTGGGTVILQRGTYVVNQGGSQPTLNGGTIYYALLIKDGVHLVGSSMFGTKIRWQAVLLESA
jgi:hypothetical protein